MKAKVVQPDSSGLSQAAAILRSGGVIGMPTETVYGLAGIAWDEKALARIFQTKDRPTFDPLIVHISPELRSIDALERNKLIRLESFSPLARDRVTRLMDRFWPGPLTLVLPKDPKIPDLATSGLPSVALRMPKHPVAQALLKEAGAPLAAPSANRFGRISPTSSRDVIEELGDRIELVLEGGSCEIGLESTVISCSAQGELTLLRPGGIPSQQIEQLVGAKLTPSSAIRSNPTEAALSPGQLESHYAPRKPLYLLQSTADALEDLEEIPVPAFDSSLPIGVLLQSGDERKMEKELSHRLGIQIIARSLSMHGDFVDAARNLFAALRSLDHSQAQLILAELPSREEGLGHAIADRLRRASARQPD